MKNILKKIGVGLLIMFILLAIFLRLRYGGGTEYPDLSTPPLYSSEQLEVVYTHDEPIGNIAASKDSSVAPRVFFTIHPESRPETIKLMEIVNDKAIPYPSLEAQDHFNTVLGLFTDNHNRLWTIDHGNHGFDGAKILAFDLSTDQLVHEFTFPSSVAKKLSFFNDLSISPDGTYLVVANVSFFGKKPSIAVYNIATGESKNLLEGHPSMRDEGYVPVPPAKKMRFLGGLVDLLTGVDGIDFSRDGKYVYYAPMGHSELFRIPTDILTDFSKSDQELGDAVQSVSKKPLSDGIRTDHHGNIYITDIENTGVYVVPPSGNGFTLIKDKRIRWADGLSLSADGMFYLADSAIPDQMLRSKKHMKDQAPYYIFRFKTLGE